jgi:hypothetical protein
VDVIRRIIVVFGNDYRTALAVGFAESGLRCDAIHWNNNKSVDVSVFQINNIHQWRFDGLQMDNCEKNIEVAHEIFEEQGWKPWVVYWKGMYLRYL